MISVYKLKEKFQDLLRPLSEDLVAREVTANQVTAAAVGMSVFYAALLCFNFAFFWVLLPVILFIRMGMNAIDGMMAREHDMKTKTGMAMNELGDIISDTALVIPFMIFAIQAWWMVAIFILIAVVNEFCGVLAYMISGERRYDGPMGKSDRALAIGVIAFLIGTGVIGPGAVFWLFLALSVLTLWSCYNRIDNAVNSPEDILKTNPKAEEDYIIEDMS